MSNRGRKVTANDGVPGASYTWDPRELYSFVMKAEAEEIQQDVLVSKDYVQHIRQHPSAMPARAIGDFFSKRIDDDTSVTIISHLLVSFDENGVIHEDDIDGILKKASESRESALRWEAMCASGLIQNQGGDITLSPSHTGRFVRFMGFRNPWESRT